MVVVLEVALAEVELRRIMRAVPAFSATVVICIEPVALLSRIITPAREVLLPFVMPVTRAVMVQLAESVMAKDT
jgi:hypothetical protein